MKYKSLTFDTILYCLFYILFILYYLLLLFYYFTFILFKLDISKTALPTEQL